MENNGKSINKKRNQDMKGLDVSTVARIITLRETAGREIRTL